MHSFVLCFLNLVFSSVIKVGELSNPGILDGVSILSVVGQHNEVVGGIPIRPAHVSVVLEDEIVMTNSRSWPDALVVVFGLLYSLHLNYPKALGSTSAESLPEPRRWKAEAQAASAEK